MTLTTNRNIRKIANHRPNGIVKNATQQFNKHIRYIDGYRYATMQANSTTTQTIVLSAAGELLLGLSVLPVTGSDITDVALTFNVNGAILCNEVNAQNLNPGNVHDMIYFPLPQPLTGKDTIKASFINSSAATVSLYLNVFYLPQSNG